MAEPFLDSLKNVVPSLKKVTEVSFTLLLTSFVLLADCATLYVHGSNILHLSELTDVIKPRLAIEAVILVIGFGILVGIAMPFLLLIVNAVVLMTVKRGWDRFELWFGPNSQRSRLDSAYSMSISALNKKAHACKDKHYLDLLKETDE